MTDWRTHAACRGTPVEVFFPEHGESTSAAKAICATCPVTVDCLAEATTDYGYVTWGVWAGTSMRQRGVSRSSERRPGIAARVRNLFLAHPDRWWTRVEIADELGVSISYITAGLRQVGVPLQRIEERGPNGSLQALWRLRPRESHVEAPVARERVGRV